MIIPRLLIAGGFSPKKFLNKYNTYHYILSCPVPLVLVLASIQLHDLLDVCVKVQCRTAVKCVSRIILRRPGVYTLGWRWHFT